MTLPKISVLMPAFNAERYIRESIESVLRQDYPDFELVIVDDGSTDRTWRIIGEFCGDPRVRIFRQRHLGVGAARNRLVRESKGELLSPHDADDVMLPGKLKKQAPCFKKDPRIAVVFSDCLLLDPRRDPPLSYFWTSRETRQGRFFIPLIYHGSAMIRKKALLRTGGYETTYPMGEDSDMWVKLSEVGRFHYVKGPVYIYRVHREGMTLTRWHRIGESHDWILRAAVHRRSRRILRFRMRTHGMDWHIRTNETRVREKLEACVYRGHPGPKGRVFQAEFYQVKSIGGIYGHLCFQGREDEYRYENDRQTLIWRSPSRRFIAKVCRVERSVRVFFEDASRFSADELLDLLILYPSIFLMRPAGWNFIHASAVSRSGEALIMIGRSLSGKTTLAMQLARQGWRLLSDETNILFSRKGGIRVAAFPRKVQIKEHAFRTFPELRAQRGRFFQTRKNPANNKWMLPLTHVGPKARLSGPCRLKAGVFPRYRPDLRGSLRVRRIGERPFFLAMKGDPNLYAEFANEDRYLLDHVLLLRNAWRSVPFYRIDYGPGSFGKFLGFVEALR